MDIKCRPKFMIFLKIDCYVSKLIVRTNEVTFVAIVVCFFLYTDKVFFLYARKTNSNANLTNTYEQMGNKLADSVFEGVLIKKIL